MLRGVFCCIALAFGLGIAAAASGQEPDTTVSADSLRAMQVADSLQTAKPESLQLAPSPYRLPPPRPLDTGFFYTTKSVLDVEHGVVRTARYVGGVQVGLTKVQPIEQFIRASIADQLAANLRETRRKLLSPREGAEGGPVLRMEFEIPNLPPVAKSIIGEGPSSLHISGYGRITMSGRTTYRTGQTVGALRQSKFPTLAMQQELSFQIDGTIGSKIYVSVDQDTKRQSDLQNSILIRYQGDDDEIIQQIEAGNTNLSLQGSQFVSGGRQHSGLFGIKASARLGDLDLTMIASQQKSSSQKKTFRGGAQESEVNIRDIDYVKRRFYFLDDSYREQYAKALEKLRADPSATVLDIGINPANNQRPWARRIKSVRVYRGYASYGGLSNVSKGVGIYARLTNQDGSDATLPSAYDPDELSQLSATDLTIWQGGWELMDESEYGYVQPDLGFIDFGRPLREGEIIGVVITYIDQQGREVTFPKSTNPSVIVAKMISYSGLANDPTWKYQWRHVYFVGAQQLSADDFRLDIVDGKSPSRVNFPQDKPGETYMQVLGLDVATGTNLDPGPDGLVDINPAKVNLQAGLVTFPYLEPFKDAFAGLPNEQGNANIYDQTKSTTATDKYQLVARYSKTSTQINLGFGVLENSEVVTLDGERLQKGIDYTINYFIGELQFTQARAQQVSNPGANLTIDYEINPIFKPAQESLVGLSAIYRLGDRGNLGGVLMFNSERTTSTRVRVGEEPTRMTVFSTYGNYEFHPNWVTSAVDWLPLIETDEPSTLRLEGEIAQSLPNLNTRGVGYIDDFEGSNNLTPIPINRTAWSFASPPVQSGGSAELPREKKGKVIWFNPFRPIEVTRVFDKKPEEVDQRQGISVLNMRFRPKGDTPEERKESWGGLMRSFGVEGVNLTKTQFIELWVRHDTTAFFPDEGYGRPRHPARGPVLHIDLGDISENVLHSPGIFLINDLNSEDLVTNPLYVTPQYQEFQNDRELEIGNDPDNNEADRGEDVGLDGCPDWYEDGTGGCQDTRNQDYDAGITSDPNGDNWSFDNKGYRVGDYEHINGTELNWHEGSGAVLRPDDEDLNGDGQLERTNQYYSYAIRLGEDSPYAVPGTYQDTSGFRLYRIPIKDFGVPEATKVGKEQPPFQFIKSIRLWVNGVEEPDYWVSIQSINFVGNDWEEKKPHGEKFSVTTIDTDNNGYLTPPGVNRERDPVSGVLRREQSLVIQFDDIGPGQTYRAERELLRKQSYTDYSRLRMYVHGPEAGLDPTWDHLAAFLRIGIDSSSYYELRVPRLYPGWDERNLIDIQLDSLTNLKLRRNGEVFSGADTVSSDGRMRIVASARGELPSLGSIRVLQLGITNLSNHTIRAAQPIQVWFDELRLEGVRNIAGQARRASADLKLSNLASVHLSTTQRDIGFGGVNAKRGSATESKTYSVSIDRFGLDKFLPPGWRVSIPVNVSYSMSTRVPRLKQGSDIELVREHDKETERSTEEVVNASTRYSKTSQSRNFVTGMTLDRLSGGVTYRLTRRITPTPTYRDSTRLVSYTGQLNYDLTPRQPRQVRLLGWVPFMPDAVANAEFAYLPNVLRFDASTTFTSNRTWRRLAIMGRDSTSLQASTVFNLSEQYRIGFQPWRPVTLNYDLSLTRDLQNEIENDISASKVAKVLADNLFRKNEIQRGHNMSFSYGPQWPWWFSQSYAMSNRYTDNSDRRRSGSVGLTAGKQYSISSNRSYSLSNYTFKVKDLFTRWGGENAPGQKEAGPAEGSAAVADSSGGSFVLWNPLEGASRFFGKHMENITGRFSYGESFQGSQVPESERPDLLYQILGIGSHPNLTNVSTSIVAQSSLGRNYTWDAATGISLPFRMRVRGKYAYRMQKRFTPQDTSRSTDTTFPDLSYTWDGVESLPILGRVMTKSDIQSSFQRKVAAQWRSSQSDRTTHTRSYRFSPLVGWNILWKNNIRTTIRSTWDRSYADQVTTDAVDKSTGWSVSLSATYELQTSRGIKKPWGDGVWKLKGNVNLSLDASVGGKKTVGLNANQNTGNDQLKVNTIQWNVKPRASYQFSRTFSGQAEIEIGATKDYKTRQTQNIRAVSISGELRFN